MLRLPCQQRMMWLFLTLFGRLLLYHSCFRWKAEYGRRAWITCIEKEDWIRLLAVTGSASDGPWSRPTDKHCVFIKNRPATSSPNKQGCLSAANLPVSVLAVARKSPRFALLRPLSPTRESSLSGRAMPRGLMKRLSSLFFRVQICCNLLYCVYL